MYRFRVSVCLSVCSCVCLFLSVGVFMRPQSSTNRRSVSKREISIVGVWPGTTCDQAGTERWLEYHQVFETNRRLAVLSASNRNTCDELWLSVASTWVIRTVLGDLQSHQKLNLSSNGKDFSFLWFFLKRALHRCATRKRGIDTSQDDNVFSSEEYLLNEQTEEALTWPQRLAERSSDSLHSDPSHSQGELIRHSSRNLKQTNCANSQNLIDPGVYRCLLFQNPTSACSARGAQRMIPKRIKLDEPNDFVPLLHPFGSNDKFKMMNCDPINNTKVTEWSPSHWMESWKSFLSVVWQ